MKSLINSALGLFGLRLIRSSTHELFVQSLRLTERLEVVERRLLSHADVLEPKRDLWNWRSMREFDHARRWAAIDRATRHARSAQQSFMIDADHVMCRVLARYWLIMNTGDGLVAEHLMANGLFELAVTEVMAHEVQPGMNVIDIGANVGYYSLLMADLVGDSGHVYVVEPNPSLEAPLRRSLCLNGFDHRFTYVPHPLADQDDREVSFIIPRGDSKNARIVHANQCGPDAGRQISLKTRKLDSIIPPGTKIDVIKIDVEGAEMLAWEGMQRVLEDNPQVTIILEFNAGRSYDPGEFLQMIARDGFTLAYIDGMRGVSEVSTSRLLGEKVGEDWMLYLKKPESWGRPAAIPGELAESYAGSCL